MKTPLEHTPPPVAARRLRIGGRVQGVGFRPFIHRLASSCGLEGWVLNRTGEVEVFIQGPVAGVEAFMEALLQGAPPLARPQLLSAEETAPVPLQGFEIRHSEAAGPPRIHVPPDYFACDDCLAEIRTPGERRHRYPFTNCTQCGPRYTLIARLPYDRPNTAMATFPLCPECGREYADPTDRRFHAQPVACPSCGPQLTFERAGRSIADTEAALRACVQALREGAIVAVKGVGGYHLLCDARRPSSIQRLRQRKPRPHKPLAVMFPQAGADGLERLREELAPSTEEALLLASPARPIVLCPRRPEATLAPDLAPGLAEVGAMLPYSPLHHLLLDDFGGPLVATSGNLGGEPVLTDPGEAAQRLTRVADTFLHHDRPILRPADDPVYRTVAGRPRPLRLGRGIAPLELALPLMLPHPLLAVGGHMKNAVALAWEDRVAVSPHIGDLDAPRSQRVFEQVVNDLQSLYGIRAERLVCDAHPGYGSSRWAARSGLPISPVYHHHAHAAALYGEHQGEGEWLIFTWDGVGLGEDGTLWGGEALLGAPGRWRRVATLRPFRLPGGEKAGREPWRSALALCWEAGCEWPQSPPGTGLLRKAWAQGLNAPITSAAGRLFDAASALLGVCECASFEGQGPMLLEACAEGKRAPLALPLVERGDEPMEIDWAPLLPMLLDAHRTVAERSAIFHASLGAVIAAIAQRLGQKFLIRDVGLTGGVFQNRLLTELTAKHLTAGGFRVRLAEQLPCNDGGLCYGQIIDTLGRGW